MSVEGPPGDLPAPSRPAAADVPGMLRAMRVACGLGQEQWAAWLEVSRRTVQRWESGGAVPDARAEAALIDVCRERRVLPGPLGTAIGDADRFARALADARLDESDAAVAASSSPDRHRAAPRDDDLIGRADDLARIRGLLAASRLVTLTGPAGVGKTRLARAVVRTDSRRAAVVELAPLVDSRGVLTALAAALAVRQMPGRSLRESVIAGLAQPVLVVLDNCEHLADLDLLVADLLASCPSLLVLATSRSAVGVPGERIEEVAPLGPVDAVDLFCRRAAETSPLAIAPSQRSVVADLCDRLDRLPLAIELAAARADVLSPEAILRHLDRQLDLLARRRGAESGRHGSLRAAIEWSYDLLDPDRRRFLAASGVFRGPFDLDAAGAVAATDIVATADHVQVLLDLHLLELVDGRSGPHVRVLETVRAFAIDELDRTERRAVAARNHSGHYRRLADVIGRSLQGPGLVAGLSRLDDQYGNIRAALGWVLAHDPAAAAEFCASLAAYWDAKSMLTEGREWLADALAASGGAPWLALARATTWSAYLACLQGDLVSGERLALDALELWDERAVSAGRGYAQLMLGHVAVERGDLDTGEALLTASLASLEAGGDRWGSVRPLNNLGEVARARGDLERAAEQHSRALAIVRDLGDLGSQPNIICGLGHVRLLQGELSVALTLAREAIEISEILGNRLGTASGLELAGLALLDDDALRAAAILGAADGLRAEIGCPPEGRDRVVLDLGLMLGRERHGGAFDDAWRAGRGRGADAAVADVVGPVRA